MIWRTAKGDTDLAARGLIMGVLNVTLDSFSDGGKFTTVESAVAHALEMEQQGADIIDVGGESTRPGAQPVSAQEEMQRVLPVIEALADRTRCEISVDTYKPEVAQAAILSGASIINDVSGLRDPRMIEVAGETGAGVIAMHMQGTPGDMQRDPHYGDVVAEIREFFRQTFARAVTSGLAPMSIAFDPGIGFGKTVAHNLTLLKNLAALRVEQRPLVVGVSRKSFIGRILDDMEMKARDWPTVALTSYACEHGANVIRVHEVKPNVEALRMTEAIVG
ncbi:MAG: dihydropteroate synthase [Chthoniobacter sp.]|nr:dihydropteroate synthase [Chthoniobacter sp.]